MRKVAFTALAAPKVAFDAMSGPRGRRFADTDPVTLLTADLRAAAFHGAAATRSLLAAGSAGTPLQRWLAAVTLGAQGRYAAACALLEPLRAEHDVVLSSLACSAVGSHRRQLGGHVQARRWDAAALARAARAPRATAESDPDGVDARGALADALLGLAADALATGRLPEARVLAGRAEGPARECWRTEVRFGWVSAELALAAGDPASARAPAEAAAKLSRAADAARHVVKSDIVLAVALTTGGVELDRSAALLLASRETATRRGWHSLSWPAAAASGLPEEVADLLHGVLRATDAAGREIAARSPWVPKFGKRAV